MQLQSTLANDPSNSARLDIREGLIFSLVLLISRVALLLVLARLTGASAFTNDSAFHLSMSRHPLEVLQATNHAGDETSHDTAHFPPLLPVFESSVGYLYQQIFPPFYSLRLLFITFELVAFVLVWRVLSLVFSSSTRRLLAGLWIVMPMTWISSTVMEQEEMLSAAFCAGIILLILRGRLNAAVVVCSLAAVSAKIFFLVPLLALVVGPSLKPTGSLIRRALLAAAPIVLVYGIAMSIWIPKGVDFPLSSFTPPTAFSTTFWSTVVMRTGMSDLTAKSLSMPLALIGALLPLALVKLRTGERDLLGMRLLKLMAAMWLWVFALFYLIGPEYYMMLVPLLIVVLNPRLAVGVLGGMLSIAWAINFFQGVEMATAPEAIERKASFIRLYNAIFPFDPGTMHTLSVAVFALLSFWLAAYVTKELLRPGDQVLAK